MGILDHRAAGMAARDILLNAFYANLRRRHLWTVAAGVLVAVVLWMVPIRMHTPAVQAHVWQFKGCALFILLWDIYLLVYLDVVRFRIKHRLFGTWNVEVDVLREYLREHGKDFDLKDLLASSRECSSGGKPE